MDKREEYDIERSWSLGNELPEDEVLSAEEQIKLSGMLDGIDKWGATKETPSSSVKSALMSEFKTSQTKKSGIWLNGVWIWLFPADKSWFKAPAFQMIALAGCAALIFLMVNQIEDKVSQPQLADNSQIDELDKKEKASQKSDVDEDSKLDEDNIKVKSESKGVLPAENELDIPSKGFSKDRLMEEVADEEQSLKDARDLNFISVDDEVGNVPAPPDGYSSNKAESAFSFNAQTTEKLTGELDQTVTDITTEKEVMGDELNKVVMDNKAKDLETSITEINTRSERNTPQTAIVASAEGKSAYKADKNTSRKKKSGETKSLSQTDELQLSTIGGAMPGGATTGGIDGNHGTNIASKSVSLKQSGDSDLLNLLYTAF